MSFVNAAGSVTVFPDLTGPSNYIGQKLTNALGFIRRDATFSYIDVQEVRECSDCTCPIKKSICLKLACDLDSANGNNCITTPLVNPQTGEPYLIKKGTLINEVVIGKRKGICVDPNACILVGVIKDTNDDCCADHCAQRLISESAPLTGDILNECGFVKVDATQKCKACCLFNLASECPNGSGCGDFDDFDSQPTETASPNFDAPFGKHRGIQCLDPKSQLQAKCHGLCIGENEDLYLSITLVNGCLRENDISLSVEVYEQCGAVSWCQDGFPLVGPGPICTLFGRR
jgi:hypothetical protein